MSAFQTLQSSARRAKVLLIGEAGSGKTHAALTFPSPCVIDAEGSIDWFADRFKFVATATKSYRDVSKIIAEARAGDMPGETLVIDSLTTIYNGLVNAASSDRDDLRPLDWGRIKRKNSIMLDELYHKLDMHVVCTGWIKARYAKAGQRVGNEVVKKNDLVEIDQVFDGDRKVSYAFDFIVKMECVDGRYFGTIVKSRSGALKAGERIENFGWEIIKPLLGNGARSYHGMTDEEQTARDREAEKKAPDPAELMTRAEAHGIIPGPDKAMFLDWAREKVPACKDMDKMRPSYAHAIGSYLDKLEGEK